VLSIDVATQRDSAAHRHHVAAADMLRCAAICALRVRRQHAAIYERATFVMLRRYYFAMPPIYATTHQRRHIVVVDVDATYAFADALL